MGASRESERSQGPESADIEPDGQGAGLKGHSHARRDPRRQRVEDILDNVEDTCKEQQSVIKTMLM